MSIATTTETHGGGDYRWLKSARGTEHPKSGTLDYSTFTANTHFPDGYVPSGLPVYRNPETDLYEPFGGTLPDVNEVWTLTEGGSGLTSWTITWDGNTSGSLDDDVSLADLQTAIDALFGAGNVVASGGPLATGPFTLTVAPDGELANQNVAAPTTTPTGGTGVVTVATATAGAKGLDGFVFHDAPLTGTADVPVSILTDVTIVAEFLPISTGLYDGRYLCDVVAAEA